ncbi:MAG: hypothetical protein ACREJG_09770 [Candidatus Rokuibacteriota bacterium]
MRVVCAWCEKEGAPSVMREEAPLDDGQSTHGVCPEHRVRLLAELTETMRAWPAADATPVRSDADPR